MRLQRSEFNIQMADLEMRLHKGLFDCFVLGKTKMQLLVKGSPFLKCAGSKWALPKQLQTPLSVKRANMGKKVLQTILASPYTPGQMWEKVLQAILASLYTTPSFEQCPYGKNKFQKGASLRKGTSEDKTQCQIVCTKRVHCVSKILTPRRMLQKTRLIA